VSAGKLVSLRDTKKKIFRVHTLESASIFPHENKGVELTDEQLEHVVGGMSAARFDIWRARTINEDW